MAQTHFLLYTSINECQTTNDCSYSGYRYSKAKNRKLRHPTNAVNTLQGHFTDEFKCLTTIFIPEIRGRHHATVKEVIRVITIPKLEIVSGAIQPMPILAAIRTLSRGSRVTVIAREISIQADPVWTVNQ